MKNQMLLLNLVSKFIYFIENTSTMFKEKAKAENM